MFDSTTTSRFEQKIGSLIYKVNNFFDAKRKLTAIEKFGFFDANFYERQINVADLTIVQQKYSGPSRSAGLLRHYFERGWKLGYSPSARFNVPLYIRSYQDVRLSSAEPVSHFLLFGQYENRKIWPAYIETVNYERAAARLRSSDLFDELAYSNRYPVVRQLDLDPYLHYLQVGYKLHLDPTPDRSLMRYIEKNPRFLLEDKPALLAMIEAQETSQSSSTTNKEEGLKQQDTSDVDLLLMDTCRFGPATYHLASFELLDSTEFVTSDWELDKPVACERGVNPDVIVKIFFGDQIAENVACIASLARMNSSRSCVFEGFIDAENTDTIGVLEKVDWLNLHKVPRGGGLTAKTNTERGVADYVFVAESDVIFPEKLVDALVEELERRGSVGMVAPKVVGFDGRLRDGGAQLTAKKSISWVGCGKDANEPTLSSNWSVDLTGGRCFMVRRTDWETLSFIDSQKPIHANLAHGIRASGREVRYLGFTTCYTSSSVPNWMSKNVLPGFAKEIGQIGNYEGTSKKQNILIIDERIPEPSVDSGSYITEKIIKAYVELGFDVTFYPNSSQRFTGRDTHHLQMKGVTCHYSPYTTGLEDVIRSLPEPDYIFIFRFTAMVDNLEFIKRHWPRVPIILHNVDLHYLREKRKQQLEGKGEDDWKETRDLEISMYKEADSLILHTQDEKNIVRDWVKEDKIIVFPYISEVSMDNTPFRERKSIMFLGGFLHEPNVDCVQYFVEQIWPLLADRLPDSCTFEMVGSNPTPEVLKLTGRRIRLNANVPDLIPHFKSARVFVAPLRYGSGIKGKLIQSLSHGVPSVATSIAAEGTGLQHGKEISIANDESAFAEEVIKLYFDQEKWSKYRDFGADYVAENFSWTTCKRRCEQAISIATALSQQKYVKAP